MLSDEEWKQVLISLREPRLISELPFPQSAITFGAPNPHVKEWVSRRIAKMIEDGEAEHVIQEVSNATGSRIKRGFMGRIKLTQKGIGVLKRMNEEAARAR